MGMDAERDIMSDKNAETEEEDRMRTGDNVSAEELSKFLSRKGAVELLCSIDMGGSRFNELAEELEISTTTLVKRLREGQEVVLIRPFAIGGEQGTAHVYSLTDRGLGVRHHMMDSGATGAYQMLREAQERFEEKAEEVRNWTVENSETLANDPYEILDFQREYEAGPFASDDEDEDEE
jgi:DNA-binding HxlR family transcriptional regulator